MSEYQKSKRARFALCALLSLLFLVVLLLNLLTPMVADDFSYCFSFADGSRIRSITQIPASMMVHRVIGNGRILPHALVQLFLIPPKLVFDLVNAGNTVLLALLFLRCFPGLSKGWQVYLLAVGAMLLWVFTPAFGQVFLWLDGSINYSWGMTLFLLCLLPLFTAWLDVSVAPPHAPSSWRLFLWSLCCFCAGAWSENGSLATLFIALCLTLLLQRRERRFCWQRWIGLGFLLAGYVFLMSAPATGSRSGGLQISTIVFQIRYIISLFQESNLLLLFLLWAGTYVLSRVVGLDPRVRILAVLLFLAGLGSLAAFVFAAYFTYRHFCFTAIFTVLSTLLLFSGLLGKGKALLPRLTAGLTAVFFVIAFCRGVLDVGSIHLQSKRREAAIAQAVAAGETGVGLARYVPASQYSAPCGLEDLSDHPDQWPNEALARYYGLEQIWVLEEDPSQDSLLDQGS